MPVEKFILSIVPYMIFLYNCSMKSVFSFKFLLTTFVFIMFLLTPSSCVSPEISKELTASQTPQSTPIQTEIYEADEQLCETDQQQEQQDVAEQELVLPDYATESSVEFLNYLDSIAMNSAIKIVLTEDFIQKFSDFEDDFWEDYYNDEAEPDGIVADILEFMEGCVGGNYLFGAQGHLVSQPLVERISEAHPNYMNGGRKEYFLEIADSVDVDNLERFPVYPDDYAWDCSGLWWNCCNTLSLFRKYTDRTAQQTYHDFCAPIEKDDLRPGDLVFYRNKEGRISHMGIVGEKGYVYEAASGFVGVVKQRSLHARIYTDLVRGGYLVFPDWNLYGRPLIYN